VEDRLNALKKVAASYEDWQPSVEGTLDDVKLAVRKLNKHLERVVIDHAPPKSDDIFKLPESASARPSTGVNADGPYGHRDDNRHREDGYEFVMVVLHSPVKGVSNSSSALPNSLTAIWPSNGLRGCGWGSGTGKLSKLPFPMFDGDNPRHGIRRVGDYFDLYGVEPYRCIKLATMNFSPAAARWLPSVEKRLQSCSWDEFCTLLLDRFGREHHELLVRQLLSIKQIDHVSEYVDCFAMLVDHL
jgi:hypothetical protein